jgi:hypothetical protein
MFSLARQARPYISKSGKRVWWFRCRVCKKNKGFNDAGKPHVRYNFGRRTIHECAGCRKPMVKAGRPKTAPKLQRYACNNYRLKHKNRVRYFHLKNGYEYKRVGNRWEPLPVETG